MNTNMDRRLSYSLCILYSCAVLVVSVTSDSPADECMPELCWSTSVISDQCELECQLWAESAVDDAAVLPALADKRAPSFIRIGKTGFFDADSRNGHSSFMRTGRLAPGDKRYSSFVRIGRAGAPLGYEIDPPNRRAFHPLMAFDKRRHSSFIRIGRNAD